MGKEARRRAARLAEGYLRGYGVVTLEGLRAGLSEFNRTIFDSFRQEKVYQDKQALISCWCETCGDNHDWSPCDLTDLLMFMSEHALHSLTLVATKPKEILFAMGSV